MADTIRELIQQNIDTVLKTITVANGYDNNMAGVQRWEQSGNSLRLVPCIIQVPGVEDKKQEPDPFTTCRLPVDIYIFMRHDKSQDSRSTDAILNSLLGDVEKALMIDITRGGYAQNTIIKSNTPLENEEGEAFCGIIIEVEIIYQHRINDPQQHT